MQTYDDLTADIVIDTDDEVRIIAARNVRVIRCGDLDAGGATIGGSLSASDATISGHLYANRLYANRAKIGGSLSANRATIGGSLSASDAKISGHLYANRATISGHLYANRATIGGSLSANRATIGGSLSASDAKISGHLYAGDAKIDGRLDASDATIGGIKIGPLTDAERVILRQIRDSIDLDMNSWHGECDDWCIHHEGYCGTTHCLAGGAQALSSDPGIRAMPPLDAGRKLIPNASYLFFAPQPIVERWLRTV